MESYKADKINMNKNTKMNMTKMVRAAIIGLEFFRNASNGLKAIAIPRFRALVRWTILAAGLDTPRDTVLLVRELL